MLRGLHGTRVPFVSVTRRNVHPFIDVYLFTSVSSLMNTKRNSRGEFYKISKSSANETFPLDGTIYPNLSVPIIHQAVTKNSSDKISFHACVALKKRKTFPRRTRYCVRCPVFARGRGLMRSSRWGATARGIAARSAY